MSDRKLKLTPINPFTEREQELIELVLAGTTSKEDIAIEMGIKTTTSNSIFQRVTERVGKITGQKPYSKSDLLRVLTDAVVFLKDES